MTEPVCGDCWWRDNLTPAQQQDQANLPMGKVWRCPCPHDGCQNPCPGCGRMEPGKRSPIQVLTGEVAPAAVEPTEVADRLIAFAEQVLGTVLPEWQRRWMRRLFSPDAERPEFVLTGRRSGMATLRDVVRRAADRPVRCRMCGCTDEDCARCVQETGQPCYWVAPGLCSACASLAQIMEDIPARSRLLRCCAGKVETGHTVACAVVAQDRLPNHCTCVCDHERCRGVGCFPHRAELCVCTWAVSPVDGMVAITAVDPSCQRHGSLAVATAWGW